MLLRTPPRDSISPKAVFSVSVSIPIDASEGSARLGPRRPAAITPARSMAAPTCDSILPLAPNPLFPCFLPIAWTELEAPVAAPTRPRPSLFSCSRPLRPLEPPEVGSDGESCAGPPSMLVTPPLFPEFFRCSLRPGKSSRALAPRLVRPPKLSRPPPRLAPLLPTFLLPPLPWRRTDAMALGLDDRSTRSDRASASAACSGERKAAARPLPFLPSDCPPPLPACRGACM